MKEITPYSPRKVKSRETILQSLKNTWASLSNSMKTQFTKRQTKDLRNQIKNKTLIHQLSSTLERKIVESLISTQDYLSFVIDEKNKNYGEKLKTHIKEVESKIPTLDLDKVIVSTLPSQK